MTITIKPKDGLKIRDPETKRIIPENGVKITELTDYWVRRINDGDVTQIPAQADKK